MYVQFQELFDINIVSECSSLKYYLYNYSNRTIILKTNCYENITLRYKNIYNNYKNLNEIQFQCLYIEY